MQQCNACGGRYEPVQADGLLYFHVCPPLSAVELAAAVDDGRVTLPKGETVEDAIARRTYERADKRDENHLPGSRENDRPVLKAEGAGTIEVLTEAAPPVVVVPAVTGDARPADPAPAVPPAGRR